MKRFVHECLYMLSSVLDSNRYPLYCLVCSLGLRGNCIHYITCTTHIYTARPSAFCQTNKTYEMNKQLQGAVAFRKATSRSSSHEL